MIIVSDKNTKKSIVKEISDLQLKFVDDVRKLAEEYGRNECELLYIAGMSLLESIKYSISE